MEAGRGEVAHRIDSKPWSDLVYWSARSMGLAGDPGTWRNHHPTAFTFVSGKKLLRFGR